MESFPGHRKGQDKTTIPELAKTSDIEHSVRETDQLLVWMGLHHYIHLSVDEVLHRPDLIIKDALEFGATKLSANLSRDGIFFLIGIPCDDNPGILNTGFCIIRPRRQFRNQQSVFGHVVTFGTKVTLVAHEAVAHHTIDDGLQIAIDEFPQVFQTALNQLSRSEVNHSRAYRMTFGVAQSLKFHTACGFDLQGVDVRRSSASIANHKRLALGHAGPQCVDSRRFCFGEGYVRAFVRPTTETGKLDLLFDLSDQAGVSPGLAHISNAWAILDRSHLPLER